MTMGLYLHGDDRSGKIKTLEAAKIVKDKWLVLGCIEADFCRQIVNIRWKALDEIYKIYIVTLLHRSDLNILKVSQCYTNCNSWRFF